MKNHNKTSGKPLDGIKGKKKRTTQVKNPKRTSRSSRKRVPKHVNWEFKPKLSNMGVVLHAIDARYTPDIYMFWVDSCRAEIQKLIRENGFTAGAKRINLIRDYTLALVEGRNPEPLEWIAISEKFRIPSCFAKREPNSLVSFSDYIRLYLTALERGENPSKEYQVILTIVNIHRLFEGLVDSSYESITEQKQNIDSNLIEEFELFVRNAFCEYKKSKYFPTLDPAEVDLEGYRLKLFKNGPNGLPKLESSHREAIELRNDPLWQPFSKLSLRIGLGKISEYVDKLAQIPVPESRKEYGLKDIILRKLVTVPDSGFKTRVVAIPDFWTQLIMCPIRAHIQAVTEFCFQQDYRLNQSAGVDQMIKVQKDCINQESYQGTILNISLFKCFDISSWTDRFHHDLQKIVMAELYTPGVAEVWAQLTVHCNWYVSETGTYIKYKQGQAMGTNGSFDIATLTDHLFIYFIHERERKLRKLSPFKPLYGKVGDDLWIYDIYDCYQDYCKKINLPINLSKSKLPNERGSVAEFCSRTAINGVDMSRVSPKVVNRSSDFRNVPQLLSVCLERDVILTPSSFPSLQNTLKEGKETYFNKLEYWMVGAAVCNLAASQGSPYSNLTPQFLIENEWLVSDHLKEIVNEPCNLIRILISQSILSILDSCKSIEGLTSSLRKTENSSNAVWDIDNIYMLDLYQADQESVTMVRKSLGFDDPVGQLSDEVKELSSKVLLPYEIIPIVRLKTLKKALTEDLLEAHSLEGDKVMDIHTFALLLNRISRKVDFQGTNIDYDSKRTYSRQFKIVKLLERSKPPFDCLVLDDQKSVDLINSILSYEELPVDWVKDYLPLLQTAQETSSDEE